MTSVDMTKPFSRIQTPWGAAQTAKEIRPGVVIVTTASHGGVRVTGDAKNKIPPAFRSPNGWYEEDCDWAIVAIEYVEDFAREMGVAPEKMRAAILRCLATWNPGHPAVAEEAS